MADYKILKVSEIKVGDTLPELPVDVSATTIVLGALAARDWRPMHHDKDFAQNQGVDNIFMNTPNLAMWFERYVTDWAGPYGRVGSMQFQMLKSILPGDMMTFTGAVESIEKDSAGCNWANVKVDLNVESGLSTAAVVRVAVPEDASDNPWKRKGDQWLPRGEA